MSSRFDHDNDGEGIPIPLWRQITKRAIHGKPGQKALRELEAVLLALPTKRLIAGAVKEGDDVCAIGALAMHRLRLADLSPDDRAWEEKMLAGIDNDFETVEVGERFGLTQTLAWLVAEANDEIFAGHTPESRYEAVLGWVRQHIDAPAPVAAG